MHKVILSYKMNTLGWLPETLSQKERTSNEIFKMTGYDAGEMPNR